MASDETGEQICDDVILAAEDWYVAHGDLVADRAWGTHRRNAKAGVYRRAEQKLIDAVAAYRRADGN